MAGHEYTSKEAGKNHCLQHLRTVKKNGFWNPVTSVTLREDDCPE